MFTARQPNLAVKHYRWLFSRYGATHQAVQWSSVTAQVRRFRILCEPVSPNDSVVDLGCGLGDLLVYLRQDHMHVGRYLGLDALPEFIDYCRSKMGETQAAQFEVFDAGDTDYVAGRDWWLVSGMFNNIFRSNARHLTWIRAVLCNAFAAANKGIAFNALSTIGAQPAEGLYYQDPEVMMGWCARKLSANLCCRHDYNPPPSEGVAPDFTLYVYK